MKEFDEKIRPAELSVLFPPLAQKIAWLSLNQRRSPIEVAAELRESSNAIAYRQYIADIQAELRGQINNTDKVMLLKKDFERIVKKWTEDGKPMEGVKYQTRNLRIQILPTAAFFATYLASDDFRLSAAAASAGNVILQAMFGNTLVVHDPILWGGDKYLSFVADWYNYS